MLGSHVPRAIPRVRFDTAWIISACRRHPCEDGWRDAGYDIAINPDAAQGMGTSVALAARLATEAGLDAVMIALADMPLVPAAHFTALIEAICGTNEVVVSSDGETRLPPAIFGSDHFAMLAGLAGDTGARAILGEGKAIRCPSQSLVDIDTPEALAAFS
jgi:CTP:molybdopterin cytidylyltransferase MocA